MAKTTKDANAPLEIPRLDIRDMVFNVVGKSPLILNRMSEKAMRVILFPSGSKTQAEKQSSLKHDPVAEYQASPYILLEAPTLLALMASAFKGAMATAALDLPGAKKSQIGRLVAIEGDYVPIYGLPRLLMSVVRSADINRTPDIRTRAIVPRWAARLTVHFVMPILRPQDIVNLLSAAGITAGVGDWRQEKGKGSYGSFTVVNDNDPELREILCFGRAEQQTAMANPEPYDEETADLLGWWTGEAKRRGFGTALAAEAVAPGAGVPPGSTH